MIKRTPVRANKGNDYLRHCIQTNEQLIFLYEKENNQAQVQHLSSYEDKETDHLIDRDEVASALGKYYFKKGTMTGQGRKTAEVWQRNWRTGFPVLIKFKKTEKLKVIEEKEKLPRSGSYAIIENNYLEGI